MKPAPPVMSARAIGTWFPSLCRDDGVALNVAARIMLPLWQHNAADSSKHKAFCPPGTRRVGKALTDRREKPGCELHSPPSNAIVLVVKEFVLPYAL